MSRYQPYPAYKDSGVEWLGEVPAHWKTIPLKRLSSCNNDVLPESTEPETEIEYVDISSVSEVYGIERTEVTRFGAAPSRARRRVKEGDVIISTVRTYLKAIAPISRERGNVVVSTGFAVIRPNDGFEPSFARYALHANYFMDQVVAESVGVSYPAINSSDLVGIKIAVPPQVEQSAISTFLDRETAKLDTLIAKQQKLINLLQEKRQALFSNAVTEGLNPDTPMKDSGVEWLGNVPAHWEIRKISSISIKITNGYVGPTRDILVENGIRYLQSLHIKGNEIRFDTPYFVTSSWSNQHSKSILAAGDVLIVQTGDIGQAAVVPEEYVGCNCHALIIVSPRKDIVNGNWLSWALNSTYGFNSLLSIQTGALHPHLNCGNVKDLLMPVPPLGEQDIIVKEIIKNNYKLDTLIEKSRLIIELLREHRTALISAAVTGKIDVRGIQ